MLCPVWPGGRRTLSTAMGSSNPISRRTSSRCTAVDVHTACIWQLCAAASSATKWLQLFLYAPSSHCCQESAHGCGEAACPLPPMLCCASSCLCVALRRRCAGLESIATATSYGISPEQTALPACREHRCAMAALVRSSDLRNSCTASLSDFLTPRWQHKCPL